MELLPFLSNSPVRFPSPLSILSTRLLTRKSPCHTRFVSLLLLFYRERERESALPRATPSRLIESSRVTTLHHCLFQTRFFSPILHHSLFHTPICTSFFKISFPPSFQQLEVHHLLLFQASPKAILQRPSAFLLYPSSNVFGPSTSSPWINRAVLGFQPTASH